MKPYKWRTRNSGYVYVDSATGSDTFGDGTMNNPYQSLGKAWRGHKTTPGVIVCRGTFCEDMADGYHGITIRGDYYGAATFDGNDEYTMYGFTTPNMIFLNCAPGNYGTNVYSGSPVLAGVGRAYYANGVGAADHVYGVAASSVSMRACAPYWGAIGGNGACMRVGVVSPKPNPQYPFWFVTAGGDTVSRFSVYDVPREHRVVQLYRGTNIFARSIFGKCAFFANDQLTFRNCTFASDCTWWNGNEEFVPTGETSDERIESLRAWMAEVVPTAAHRLTFDNCRLLSRSSREIWNNPDEGDLTLRYEACDEELLNPGEGYRGAFPPAINIPIMSDSQGVPNTWDETTACGIISVAGNAIVIGDGSGNMEGEIKSKVIVANPDDTAISGIFAQYANQMQSAGILLGEEKINGAQYRAGETLPIGRYRMSGGAVIYNGVYLAATDVLVVSAEGTTFADDDEASPAVATAIEDANEIDYMWLRSSVVQVFIRASDGLRAGGQYVNVMGKPITYRGRVIANGESFEAANDSDTFVCDGDPDYRVAAVFDDSRVPSEPWIPAQLWGAYFADKIGNAYQKDTEGKYLGSGNWRSWLPTSEGGVSGTTFRTPAHARYIQLRIKATKA